MPQSETSINIYGSADDVTMTLEMGDLVYLFAVSAAYFIGLLIYNIYKPKKKKA